MQTGPSIRHFNAISDRPFHIFWRLPTSRTGSLMYVYRGIYIIHVPSLLQWNRGRSSPKVGPVRCCKIAGFHRDSLDILIMTSTSCCAFPASSTVQPASCAFSPPSLHIAPARLLRPVWFELRRLVAVDLPLSHPSSPSL